MDSGRASALDLLQGLPTSQEVHRPSKPCLSLYSRKIEFGSPLGGGAKPQFLHTFYRVEHHGIYRRSKAMLWPKIGHVRPTCQGARPYCLVGWPCFLLAPPLGNGYLEHFLFWTRRQNGFWKYANTWPASQGGGAGRPHFGSVGPGFCSTSSRHVIFFVTMPYFGHI
jgi:hypothetical protein